MDDTLIYRKTEKGIREMSGSTHVLDRHLRRLLIVVDGIRTVAELSVYVRSSEVEKTIHHLEAKGFIEKIQSAGVKPAHPAAAPAANDPAVFAVIKRNAMIEIRHRLGPVSTLLVNEIDACAGPMELRKKLRNIENVLVHVLGQADGVALARKIGSELTRLETQKK